MPFALTGQQNLENYDKSGKIPKMGVRPFFWNFQEDMSLNSSSEFSQRTDRGGMQIGSDPEESEREVKVAALVGKKSTVLLIVILGTTSWPVFARLARAEVMRIKEKSFIESARVLGSSNSRIIWKHILLVHLYIYVYGNTIYIYLFIRVNVVYMYM